MSNTLVFITDHLPEVTIDDVRRFSVAADIRDATAFAAELQAFVHERVESVQLPPALEAATVAEVLAGKAAALRADRRWVPDDAAIQRGRAMLIEAFDAPHNLPLPEFAALANKSRQQIYKDIHARRLLALNVGPRGQRLPDWQLDPVRQQLTQAVLEGSEGVDNWTLYHVLSEPLDSLGGLSPVQAVRASSIDTVTRAARNALGLH